MTTTKPSSPVRLSADPPTPLRADSSTPLRADPPTPLRADPPTPLRADPPASRSSPIGLRALLVVAVGLVVGALTSFGQTYLGGALNAFVNSASAWLVAPFFLGAVMPTRRTAAAAGLTAALAQLVGYYATAHLRGYPTGGAIVAFWGACALIGGPLFGAGGHLWRNGSPRVAGLGATLLPAAFLAEGLWVYVHELRYYATAALWIGIGIALAVLLPTGLNQRRWLPLTLILGIAGEIAISQIYRQTF